MVINDCFVDQGSLYHLGRGYDISTVSLITVINREQLKKNKCLFQLFFKKKLSWVTRRYHKSDYCGNTSNGWQEKLSVDSIIVLASIMLCL